MELGANFEKVRDKLRGLNLPGGALRGVAGGGQ
jgi:hypothetical protein